MKKIANNKYLNIILKVLVLVFIFIMIYICQMNRIMNSTFEELVQTSKMVSSRVKINDQINSDFTRFEIDDDSLYTELYIMIMGDEFSQEKLDSINEKYDIDGNAVFFIDAGGKLYYTDDEDIPELDVSDECLNKLIAGKCPVYEGDYVYFSSPFDNGHLIIRWDIPKNLDLVKIDGTKIQSRNNVMIVDAETGEHVYSTDGTYIDDNVATITADSKHIPDNSEMEMCEFVNTSSKNPFVRFNNWYYGCFDTGLENYRTVSYVSMSSIVGDTIIFTVISFVSVLLLIFAAYQCRCKITENDTKSEKDLKKLFGSVYLDRYVFKKTALVMLVSSVTLGFAMAFVLLAVNFSDCYQDSYESLANIDNSVDALSEAEAVYEEEWISYKTFQLYTIDEIISDFDEFTEQKNLESIMDIIGAEEISIYDSNGVIVYSSCDTDDKDSIYTPSMSDGRVGYKLTQKQDDAEYRLWNLYEGEKINDSFKLDDGSDEYIFAIRREGGENGIIKIRTKSEQVLNSFGLDKAILSSDFTGVMFYSGGNTEKIYFIGKERKDPRLIRNPFDEHVFENNALETAVYNRTIFSLVTRMTDDMALINGIPYSTILGEQTSAICWTLLGYLIIFAVTVFSKSLYSEKEVSELRNCNNNESGEGSGAVIEPNKANAHGNDDRGIVKYIKDSTDIQRILKKNMVLCMLYLISMFVLDYFTSGVSIISLLFEGNWDKGFNYISFAYIIFTLVCLLFIEFIVGKVIAGIARYVDAHAATVMNLIKSIVDVVLLVVVCLMDLSAIGVDTTTLVAGVGVTGLALGIGAQNTINDFIAGCCMVLDGKVKVGDYVEVNDFYGKVTDLSVRTITIASHKAEITLNNSNIGDIINYSRNISRLSVTVAVGKEDYEKFLKMIDENQDRIAKATSGNLIGPLKKFDVGVEDMEEYVKYVIVYNADTVEKYRKTIPLYIKSEMLDLAKENGIDIISMD